MDIVKCDYARNDRTAGTSLVEGDVVGPHQLETIDGQPIRIPDPKQRMHLQFRRYAGCPVCHLHLRSIAQRHDEIRAAGITEVVVFHSARERMLEFEGLLPFAAIADPEKWLYREFGVERMSMRDIIAGVPNMMRVEAWRRLSQALREAHSLRAAVGMGEERMGLPADFLIEADGTIAAAHYGRLVDDQWSVDELLEIAAA